MKKCPICELNYIEDNEDMCSICRGAANVKHKVMVDSNKSMVERDLLPFLRGLDDFVIEQLTTKEASFNLLGIRLPLLKRCKGETISEMRKEVKDKTGHGRYYVEPYDINGTKYYICSQWWDAEGNKSKKMLKIINEYNKRQK